jgi:tetratricopeptide (TPR) repeat protein
MKHSPFKYLVGAAVGCLLMAGPAVHAGLYNPEEPTEGLVVASTGEVKALSMQAIQFPELIRNLSSGMLQSKNTLRDKYQAKRDRLEAKRRFGRLSVDEQLSLSVYLIRLKQYNAAIDLLTPLAAQERRNFMVHANLITAHQLDGQLDRAREYLVQVQDGQPQGGGLTPQQCAWLGRVEKYHQALIKLRFREWLDQKNAGPAARNRLVQAIDDLFGVRFVGPSGQYEAGRLADDQKAKLPADAVAIVQQLLIWLPDDTRLYWLLGELLNAQGDLEGAATAFNECQWVRGLNAPELRAHHQVVREALAQAPAAPAADLGVSTPPEAPSGWLPDRQHLLIVGVVAGLLLLGLAYLQLREIRHRRQGKSFLSRRS